MTPLKPWFGSQSQTSYGRMYTRMGSFDFATKLKISPQTLMPGFGPFYRSILLIVVFEGKTTFSVLFKSTFSKKYK